MSKVFIHKYNTFKMENGKKVRHEEEIIDDDKGLKFKLFKQSDDKKEKFFGKLTGKDKWIYIKTVGDDKKEEELSHADLLKKIKGEKDLKFVLDYLSKRKMEGGIRRSKSRKGTKKASKKRSRKGSKKGSKKRGSKKRKQSRSKSKKRSKRGSKKVSKKRGSKKSKQSGW